MAGGVGRMTSEDSCKFTIEILGTSIIVFAL